MKAISKLRFDAIAGYARHPMAAVMARELGYFDHPSGRVLGMHLFDVEDREHFGMVFAQDSRLRYRSVGMTPFLAAPEGALRDLSAALDEAAFGAPEDHHQGDEKGPPVDFFTPVHADERLNPDFSTLRTVETFSPALGVIEPMMRWYEDADGNFVEQFQTTGFDQRIWELYLFATLVEQGYELDRSDPVPDFHCSGLQGSMTIEAVTVGPTRNGRDVVQPPPVDTEEERLAYVRQYMPIKFGSALFSKLQKKYWLRSSVAGKPFVLAVADFSSPGSMMRSGSALETYLYGYEHHTRREADGRLTILPRKVENHSWEGKTIPSGFFDLPGAEHVSAVITSSSGTISKFNRMGLLAGFGTGRVLMIREGTMVDHDPDATGPKLFRAVVNAPGYHETWVEGLNVFHNPKALRPLDPDMLVGAAHHMMEADGRLRSHTPDFWPFASFTRLLASVDVGAALAELGDRTHAVWTMTRDATDRMSGTEVPER